MKKCEKLSFVCIFTTRTFFRPFRLDKPFLGAYNDKVNRFLYYKVGA